MWGKKEKDKGNVKSTYQYFFIQLHTCLHHPSPLISIFFSCRLHSQIINISLACRILFSGYQASSWEHYLSHNGRGWAVIKVLNYATLRIIPHEVGKLLKYSPVWLQTQPSNIQHGFWLMCLIYPQDILLKLGAGIAILLQMKTESLREINWTRHASWSSQINLLDPFTTIATPCLFWLQELAGFKKFSSRTISSCFFTSQRAHDYQLALNLNTFSPQLPFRSLFLP